MIFDAVQHDHPATAIPQEARMTVQPDRPQPAPRQPRTWAQAVHSAVLHVSAMRASLQRDLTGVIHGDVMHRVHEIEQGAEHAAALLERVVTDPVLDDLVEAALKASGAGVAAEVFQTMTAGLLNAARDRQQQAGTGPQPAVPDPAATSAELPAVTGTPDGTGPQPAADSGQA